MEWREFAARCTQGAGARHKMGKQNAPAALGPESSLGLLPTIRTEAWELSKLASPIMIVSMLQFLMVMVDMGMVGRLGTDELAASALANAYFNCLQHPLVGCATALDTLLAQSYGANQKISYGQWAKVGVLTLLTLSIPVMGMLIVAEPLLLLIGQDSHLSERAGMFCRLLVPGVMPFFGFIGTSKYLQAQNILAPAVWIALFANGMNVFLNWLLIYGLEFGFEGAPVATSLSRWAQFLCLLCYLFYSRAQHAETIPSWRDPEGLSLAARVRKFIKLGAPGALMLGLEAWSFEATTLLSGLIGTVPLAAHMVLINTTGFTFLSFPFALGIASSIRVGWLLGASEENAARNCAKATFTLMAAFMLALSGAKVVLRWEIGRIFSDDPRVVSLVAQLVYIAALFQISDGCQAAVAGIFRGMGRQRTVAGLNLAGFWVIGISCGSALAFGTSVGVAGLWWGLAIGLTCTAVLGVFLLARVDWGREVRLAQLRIEAKDEDRTNTAETVPNALKPYNASALSPDVQSPAFLRSGAFPTSPAHQEPSPSNLAPHSSLYYPFLNHPQQAFLAERNLIGGQSPPWSTSNLSRPY